MADRGDIFTFFEWSMPLMGRKVRELMLEEGLQ
jgi:hypothetical protein